MGGKKAQDEKARRRANRHSDIAVAARAGGKGGTVRKRGLTKNSGRRSILRPIWRRALGEKWESKATAGDMEGRRGRNEVIINIKIC